MRAKAIGTASAGNDHVSSHWRTGDPRLVVGRLLVVGSVSVMTLHLAVIVARSVSRPESGVLVDVFAMLDAGQERGLAAWWTASMLVIGALGAVLVGHLARTGGHRARVVVAWRLVAVLFALLSFDEIVSLHERGAQWTAAVIDAESEWVRLGWLIPGAGVLAVALVALVPMFRALPARPRRCLLAGLGVAIAAAMGLELAFVLLSDAGVAWRWLHAVMAAEEAAEMAGVITMIAGLAYAVRIRPDRGRLTLDYAA